MAEKYIALPKGISENTFDAAITAFRNVLGDSAVLVSAKQLAPYIKTMMPVPDADYTLSAALLATTVEQIQKIVGICNRIQGPRLDHLHREKSGIWLRGARPSADRSCST